MRRMSGFSLMEMMVVLLIVAIVAAASAPMVSKKLSGASTAAGVGCLWRTHEDADKFSVTYNSVARGNKSVIIGAKQTDVSPMSSFLKPRLHIKTASTDNPHIRFESGQGSYNLQVYNKGIWFSDSNIKDKNSGNYVAIGDGVTAKSGAVAIGSAATASYNNNVAIGSKSTSSGGETVAIGSEANSSSAGSIAIGYKSVAPTSAVSIGRGAVAKEESVVLGTGATTQKYGSVAVGHNSNTSGTYSVAVGHSSRANGARSVAIGKSSSDKTPCGASSDGIGIKGYANGTYSVAIGDSSFASSSSGVALGAGSNAGGSYATALGPESYANSSATAVGYDSDASGSYSVAVGRGAGAYGNNAIAIGAVDAYSNEVRLGTDGHKVYLGGCEFENGTAYIDTLHVKRLYVEDSNNTYFNASGDGIKIPGDLEVYGELYASSLSVGHDATFGTANSNSLVYVQGDFVSDGNSIISRKDGKQAIYKVYSRESHSHNDVRAGHNNLFNFDVDGAANNDNKIEMGGSYKGNTGSYSSFDGSFTTDSDRRLKNVGEVFTAGLEEIKKLEVFNFVYKKDSTKTPRVGVMAQDLMKIFPNAVFKGDDGFYRIRMEDMFYALVNAVKELDKKIDLLAEKQKKIDDLEKRVDTLEKRLAKLEKLVKEK